MSTTCKNKRCLKYATCNFNIYLATAENGGICRDYISQIQTINQNRIGGAPRNIYFEW